MRLFPAICLSFHLGCAGLCDAAPFEPPRGSEVRGELLDAFRPLAIYDLGAPIEFQVLELMVDGDTAFARLIAQRPGGVALELADTPMVAWRHADPYGFDGPRYEVFFVRDGTAWQVVNYGLGSTDVWWAGYRCDTFGPLLQDYGC